MTNFKRLLLIALVAALSFGGSFTCKSDNDSATFTDSPQTGAK